MLKETKKAERKLARLIHEEKRAYLRFRDLVQKYRQLVPYVSMYSETLEKKIERMLEHREESENNVSKIDSAIQKTSEKIEKLKQKEREIDEKEGELVDLYNRMLSGEFPVSVSYSSGVGNLEGLRGEKERLLAGISEAFMGLEGQMQKLEKRKKLVRESRIKAESRLERLEENLKIAEQKISLYRSDIRKLLMEFNDHLDNEREFKKQYVQLIKLMNKVPDLSQEAQETFKKALKQSQPDVKIIELTSPVSRGSTASNLQ